MAQRIRFTTLLFILFLYAVQAFAQTSSLMEVYQVFQAKCISCHSGAQPSAGLDLKGTAATDALRALQVAQNITNKTPQNPAAKNRGEKLAYPGRPDLSFLFKKVNGNLEETIHLIAADSQAMPPYGNLPLSNTEKEIIRQWILYGAKTSGTQFDPAVLADYHLNGGVQSFPSGAPAAPSAAEGFQFKFGPFYLPPSGEAEHFQKYELKLPEEVEVNRITIQIGSYSHHLILYNFETDAAAAAVPHGFRDSPYHSGVGLVAAFQYSDDLIRPAGTAFRWKDNLILDLNFHYINYSGLLPLQAEGFINVYTQPVGTSKQQMYSTLVANPNIPIPNNGQLVTHTQSIVTPAANIFLWGVMGHTHKYGKAYKVYKRLPGNQKGELLYDGACPLGKPGCPSPWYDYQHTPMRYFEAFEPITLNLQNGIIHEASWVNDGPAAVNFGPTSQDEMMVMIMLYVVDTNGLSTALEIPESERQTNLIYPNPASDHFTLELPDWNGVAQFTLYTITGQQVWQKTITSDRTEMVIPAPIHRGLYYWRLHTADSKPMAEGRIMVE